MGPVEGSEVFDGLGGVGPPGKFMQGTEGTPPKPARISCAARLKAVSYGGSLY